MPGWSQLEEAQNRVASRAAARKKLLGQPQVRTGEVKKVTNGNVKNG